MISFENDYSEGCADEILSALSRTNKEQLSGYGEDTYSKSAKEKIRACIGAPRAEIFFLNGGTETNQLVISTVLDQYQGVLAAQTGHVNVHEAGAIEATGHKVLALPSYDGKMKAADLKNYLATFYADGNHDHMVFPGMVYISHPTEYGTLYSKSELEELSSVCHENKMPLYIDGARLAYGLAAKTTDVTIQDIARIADIFYIGGTKCGALTGEALVFPNGNAPSHYVTRIKQHGDLLAKGRLIGIQFDTLFTNDLYFELGKHGIETAEIIKNMFKSHGYTFYLDSPTNQQFFIIDNAKLEQIAQKVKYSFWEKYDDTHTVVRFASSWATTKENLEALKRILEQIK